MSEYVGCQDMRDLLTLYLHASRSLKIGERRRHNIIDMGHNIVIMMDSCDCDTEVTVEQLKAHVEGCSQCQHWLNGML